MHRRNASATAQCFRQQIRLVERPLPTPPPVQRHRCDRVEALIPRKSCRKQLTQAARQGLHSGVLEKVDQFAQNVLIRSIRVRRIKTAKTAAAESAASFLIQGKCILERRPATATEEFGAQRLGSLQAIPADWNACDRTKGLAANAAIVGIKQGKKGVRCCSDYRGTEFGNFDESATREDPPPTSGFYCS